MTENKPLKNLKISVFFITLLILSIAFVVLRSDADLDLWHRMAVGKIFSQTGWIIYHDIFSYFPTKDMWVDHEWLSGVVFYFLGNNFGDMGILALQIAIVFTVLVLVYKANKLLYPEDKHRIGYYLVVLLAIIPGLSTSLRCQAFTYLFFALWIYLLEKLRRGESRFIWIFPATSMLWANMHGGFLAGIGLIIFYIIGELLNKKPVSKYLLILGLVLPVTLINPYGIDYWNYLLGAVTMDRPYITEWEAFNPFKSIYNAPGAKILFLFLLCGYGYKLFKKRFNFDKVELIALSATLYLAFRHERHLMFFGLLAAVFCYRHFIPFFDAIFDKVRPKILSLIPKDRIDQAYFTKWSSVYLFLIMTCVYLISVNPVSIKMSLYPVRAIEFIRINNLSGNFFVPFNFGSYALWKLYPNNLVSIDGRYEETYKSSSYLEVCSVDFCEKDWEKVINKYNHNVILLRTKSDIYKKLKNHSEWKTIYKDKKAAVLVPASIKKTDWKQPVDDEEYYIKTKYENSIDFKF